MSDIKVSIIVHVYNTEKYLQKCLDSLTNQTLNDLEIICVNDGSTDNSLKILQDNAIKDDRIKILNQENKKQGAARNAGMKVANGEYIGFVDSGDWVDLNYFENPNSIVNTYSRHHKKQFNIDKNNARCDVVCFLKRQNVKIRNNNFWYIKKDFPSSSIPLLRIKAGIYSQKLYLFSFLPIGEIPYIKNL